MGRKCIEVKSLYGATIESLTLIANNSKCNYTREVIQAIIQRYNGVPTGVIAKNLNKCVSTITSYINNWNEKGIVSVFDNRGGNIPSSLTDDIIEDIRDIVLNKSPHDFGYEQSRWTCALLCRYIKDTYGKKYSDTWIRKLLKRLGFTYKRGVFKPTLGDKALQESFKKNVPLDGYY